MSGQLLPVWELVRTAHAAGLRLAEQLDRAGLTPTQFAILMHLDEEPGLSQAELARRVLVRPQSMGVLIQSLLGRTLLERLGPGGRGWPTALRVTDDGRDALAAAWPIVTTLNSPTTLGLTPAQAALLVENLETIRVALNQATDSPRGSENVQAEG